MVRSLVCICLLFFASCGQRDFPDYSGSTEQQREEQQSGIYFGELIPLNKALTGPIEGHTKIWIQGIQFYTKVILKRGIARLRHEQYIHAGSECPNAAQDLNSDGIISISEVMRSSGKRLIPLDRILKTQKDGLGWFPTTSKNGSYVYSRSTAVFHLLEDLRSPDSSSHDHLGKLGEGEGLDLHRRTLILYANVDNILLPVACAEIRESFDF